MTLPSHHKKPHKPELPTDHLFITSDHQLFLPRSNHPSSSYNIPFPKPWQTIARHPFTSQLDLIFQTPDSSSISNHSGQNSSMIINPLIQHISKMDAYQRFTGFHLSLLMQSEVAQTYLRSGSLIVLSKSSIPGDDVLAVDGYGKIHMRLNRSTYETLGLPGRPSKFGPRRQYYVVEIDMRDKTMRPGQKGYDRIRDRLKCFPSNPFSGWMIPEVTVTERKWEVLMVWVNEKGELQEIDLPINPTITRVDQCHSTLSHTQKPFPSPWHPTRDFESQDDLLDLFEHLGAANLSTSDSYPMECPMNPIETISAVGFFHPIKVYQFTLTLINTYQSCSITGHTASLAPFSFLNRKQMDRGKEMPVLNSSQPRKRQKNGKGTMKGPERGIDAGLTSWTLVCFPSDDIPLKPSDTELPGSCPDDSMKSQQDISSSGIKRAHESRHDQNGREGAPSSGDMLRRRWVLYESVGHNDTHC
ncbi:ribonuclease P 40kDa subunit-domain-containing protein [Melampsora americana]|nr:ribonuclease P 40kDa subunit-domain-containing protein [Melampsora americana]